MAELTVEAKTESLTEVLDFINRQMNGKIDDLVINKIDVAVEEIFINIANYAYHPQQGYATIRCQIDSSPCGVTISFVDSGKPYNPLINNDPDITLGADEREVGGLGVFLVKQIMDEVKYQYLDGKNILTLVKRDK